VPYPGGPDGSPPPRRHDQKVLLLVLGTVGLVVVAGVVAFLLLSRHGSTSSAAAATPAPVAPPSATAAPRSSAAPGVPVSATPEASPGTDTVPVPLVATGADCSYPPSVDGNDQPVSYEPAKAVDGDPTTAWRCPGAGGHTIQLAPGQKGYVTDLGLVPGYAKVDPATGVDRFLDNHTVTQVVWRIDDGGSVVQVVQDIRDPRPQLTWVHLSRPLALTSLSLTVTGTGNPGSRQDSTPISTVAVAGGLGTPGD
jgi:hypothetical protein